MKRLYFTITTGFLMLLQVIPVNSQDIFWNSSPQTGFVFEISNNEAQKLLTLSTTDTIFNGLLHTLVDTFDVEKGWLNRPPKGHFILAKIVENKVYCEYTSVFPYQVFLLKEYDALAIQVLDMDGNVREDAKVKLKHKRLRIDPKSKTYRIENEWVNWKHSIAMVEMDGFRSIFNIEKHEIPTWNNYNYYDDGPAFYSYMITDKNKYKPGESVRYKSYALSQSKIPLHKKLDVWLTGYGKYIKLGQVEPHRPGSFAGEFQLHDSLQLVLDKDYYLDLREKNGRMVASCSFKYEDYELSDNKLDVTLATARQFYPDKNMLSIICTDVNGLLVKDAKATITVKTVTIQETYQPLVILPDTLLFKKIDLDPNGPTQIEIPSGLFEKTNTSYQVYVTVINSQNQRMEWMQSAMHYYSQYELTTDFSGDSICFDILNNGKPMKDVPINLKHNWELEGKEVRLPCKEKINPATIYFELKNDFVSRQFSLSQLNPRIELIGGIQKDSFNIQLQNPQKLDVSWYIYQGSTLLAKGFDKELEFLSLIEDRTQTYYVELLYSFGGQEYIKRSQFEFKEEFLDVSLNIPDRVYPGQQVDAMILVRNQLGDPVRGVDLTALAVTGKLNYNLPDLPYYGTSSTPRPKRDYYSKSEINKYSTVLDLNYKRWNKLAGLDTMMFYQFTYPGSNQFKYTVDITDSTQFVPYVMKNGRAMQVFVIEVDRKPVYYSWVNQPREYSFYVSPNKKHEISLRLYDRVLVLDSTAFDSGKKTIFSFDLDHLPKEVKKVFMLGTELTSTERNRHINYISAFKRCNTTAFLESKNEFTPLFLEGEYGSIITGPVTPGKKTFADKNKKFKITYQHTGGYTYSFEDNIVYKLNADNLLPVRLNNIALNPMATINDKIINRTRFFESAPYQPYKWKPWVIDVTEPDSRLKILLPYDSAGSGTAVILFEDCKTKRTISPCYDNYRNQNSFHGIPAGYNNTIVLYNNGSYLKMDSINLGKNSTILVNLKQSKLHPMDSLSSSWKYKYYWNYINCYSNLSRQSPVMSEINGALMSKTILKSEYYYSQSQNGNVKGTVYDEQNNPLIGVSIIVKGTQTGTVSDIDGRFSLYIDSTKATLVFSYIGYISEEIEVEIGSEITVTLVEDLQQLDEIVVVGYGTMSKSDVTGSISRVSSEDVLNTPEEESETSENKDDKLIREAEARLYQELLSLNSIRSSFSDVGFWEPRLYTDRRGESKFKVTFPDDITRWDAVVYAMNRNLQTGTARKSIKSYKPLMAELHVPQFLTRGDTAFFLGKVLNYTSDSIIQGKVKWSGALTDFEKDIRFTGFHTDKLPVYATGIDSITSRYMFSRDDGYLDGEERTVPIVEQGIVRAEGSLSILQNGTVQVVKAPDNATVIVEILDNQIAVYGEEVRYLIQYKYACNEQLASKLIGLINHKLIMQYEGRPFKYDKDVNKIIAKLLKNQNQEFLWSWWDVSSNTSYWMSAHILRALKCAKDAGYQVDLDIDNLARKAEYKFGFLKNYSIYDIDLLHSLATWNASLDYSKHLQVMDSIVLNNEYVIIDGEIKYISRVSFLKEKLLLQEIRQLTGLDYQRDTLLKFKKEGIMGEAYFSDNKPASYWYKDDMAANIIAYRIAGKDSLLKDLSVPMQLYFLSSRKNGGWNTYQSSNVLMTILPDLLAEGLSAGNPANITLSGKETGRITNFPYHIELQPGEELQVHKESGLPMYYMQYMKERVTEAKTGVEGFEIRTSFDNDSVKLEAGKPVALRVEVKVKKDASFENVMIEVPIPGACSYADKRQPNSRVETHREYFKERTVIFCENMDPGKYVFMIYLLPRFTGKYLMNPAQVSLMYVPVVNANTDMKQVVVEEPGWNIGDK